MARIVVTGNFHATALADVKRRIAREVDRAIADALKPPPPGMVRVHLDVTVSEALLDDEMALGAFLVRALKKRIRK